MMQERLGSRDANRREKHTTLQKCHQRAALDEKLQAFSGEALIQRSMRCAVEKLVSPQLRVADPQKNRLQKLTPALEYHPGWICPKAAKGRAGEGEAGVVRHHPFLPGPDSPIDDAINILNGRQLHGMEVLRGKFLPQGSGRREQRLLPGFVGARRQTDHQRIDRPQEERRQRESAQPESGFPFHGLGEYQDTGGPILRRTASRRTRFSWKL